MLGLGFSITLETPAAIPVTIKPMSTAMPTGHAMQKAPNRNSLQQVGHSLCKYAQRLPER